MKSSFCDETTEASVRPRTEACKVGSGSKAIGCQTISLSRQIRGIVIIKRAKTKRKAKPEQEIEWKVTFLVFQIG